jgi:signal peptidase II
MDPRLYDLAKEHLNDLYREAEHERLVRAARSSSTEVASAAWRGRLLSRLQTAWRALPHRVPTGHTVRWHHTVPGVAAVVLVVDQLSKALASGLAPDAGLRSVHNRDFSMQWASAPRLAEVALMATVLAFTALSARGALRAGRIPAWPVGLVLGGSLGNLVDRTALGSVRDFLPLGHVVINVADVAVAAGLIAIALTYRREASEGR